MDLLKRLNELFINNFGKPNSQRQKLTDPIERQAAKNTDSAALQLAATPVTAAAELAMPVLASLLTYSPEAEGAIRPKGRRDQRWRPASTIQGRSQVGSARFGVHQ